MIRRRDPSRISNPTFIQAVTLIARLKLIPVALLVAVSACGLATSRIATANDTEQADTAFKAAGCYLPLTGGVVLGVNRLTNKVQLPLGSRSGKENAKETAARETYEETGIKVNVGLKLLSVSKGSVHIFLCRPKDPVGDYAALEAIDRREVKEVLVLDPGSLTNHDGRDIDLTWRFKETRLLIQALDHIIPRKD